MLCSLLVDLDLYLMLLTQVLQLSFFVSLLCLFILELLLCHNPEVVHSLSLILVQACQVLLSLDHLLQIPALYPE